MCPSRAHLHTTLHPLLQTMLLHPCIPRLSSMRARYDTICMPVCPPMWIVSLMHAHCVVSSGSASAPGPARCRESPNCAQAQGADAAEGVWGCSVRVEGALCPPPAHRPISLAPYILRPMCPLLPMLPCTPCPPLPPMCPMPCEAHVEAVHLQQGSTGASCPWRCESMIMAQQSQ